MKSVKGYELIRKFGKNLLNNRAVIELKNNENINDNIKKISNAYNISKKNYHLPEKTKNNESKIHSKNILKEKKYIINVIIKKQEDNNLQYLDEYLQDIIRNINYTKSQNICDYSSNDIFSLQDTQYINQKSRNHTIQSIIYQSYIWKLNNETIYLTVNIMDRFIEKNKIKNKEYELIGLASFFIASKYEDIYSPDVQSLTNIFSFKYHYKDILDKETEILQSLDYSLHYISSYKILNLLYHLSNINDINLKHFADMILEISLTDLNIMKYSQIKRAIASFLFAKKMFAIKSGNNFIKLLFSYDEKEIENIIKKLFNSLKDIVILKDHQNLIAEKYRAAKFNSIFSAFEKKLNEKIAQKNKSKEQK